MNRLRDLFDEVGGCFIEFDAHDDSLYDVVFDINTAESALMGVAEQVLSSMTPSANQLAVLDKRLMHGDTWLLFDGGECDLTVDKVLLRHAHALVSLQQECKQCLKDGLPQ